MCLHHLLVLRILCTHVHVVTGISWHCHWLVLIKLVIIYSPIHSILWYCLLFTVHHGSSFILVREQEDIDENHTNFGIWFVIYLLDWVSINCSARQIEWCFYGRVSTYWGLWVWGFGLQGLCWMVVCRGEGTCWMGLRRLPCAQGWPQFC